MAKVSIEFEVVCEECGDYLPAEMKKGKLHVAPCKYCMKEAEKYAVESWIEEQTA